MVAPRAFPLEKGVPFRAGDYYSNRMLRHSDNPDFLSFFRGAAHTTFVP
jgi:hypothetical protein